MGLTDMFHTSSNTLAPVNPPVAVYPHMVRNVPVTLTLREKAWSLSGVSALHQETLPTEAGLTSSGRLFDQGCVQQPERAQGQGQDHVDPRPQV